MKPSPKRATIYFDADLHRALRLKAAETDQSVSDLVNLAVQLSLSEDVEDLAAFEARAHEGGQILHILGQSELYRPID